MSPAHASFPGHKILERELPSWTALRHENILPFYGVFFFRTLPQKDPHRDIGMSTDVKGIKPRLYMVRGSSYMRNNRVDSGSIGIAVAEKQEHACLPQKQS